MPTNSSGDPSLEKQRDEMRLRAEASAQPIARAIAAQANTSDDEATITEWSVRARQTFQAIHQLKHDFFEAVFTDAPWDSMFDFADESRRYSQFVKLVFSRLREVSHLPSSTEVNSWFWLFKRRQQFREADVPEKALPQTRKVQEALQSATAGMKSDQARLEAQIEILEKAALVADGEEISTSAVKAAAAELEITAAPLPKLPDFTARELDDLTRTEWRQIVHLQQRLRAELLEPKDPMHQRQRLLKLSATFEDLTRHQTTWVVAVFESERFVGCLARQMVQKRIVTEIGTKKISFTRFAEADVKVVSDGDLIGAVLPMAETPEDGHLRLVGVRGDRKVRQCLKVNTGRVKPLQTLEMIDLQTLQAWFARGGIPVGTYVDEVMEPSFLHPDDDQDGDGSPVL